VSGRVGGGGGADAVGDLPARGYRNGGMQGPGAPVSHQGQPNGVLHVSGSHTRSVRSGCACPVGSGGFGDPLCRHQDAGMQAKKNPP